MALLSLMSTFPLAQWGSLRMHYTAHAVVLTYYLNRRARTCYSRRIVTRCRFTNWANQVRVRSRTVHFLSTSLISFRLSRGIVLVMAPPAREMDSSGRQ